MKKTLTIAALLFFISAVHSQTTLSFCTYVEPAGYCVFDNNKFITSPDSTTGKIYMQVRSTAALGSRITYKIFIVGKDNTEKLTQSFDQAIQADWFFAWNPYIFPTNTKYNVKIYNEADKMICSKSFELVAGK